MRKVAAGGRFWTADCHQLSLADAAIIRWAIREQAKKDY
jgi:hypothetical protein